MLCPLIVQHIELGSSDRMGSSSAGKNTGPVLKPCCACKCGQKAITEGIDI